VRLVLTLEGVAEDHVAVTNVLAGSQWQLDSALMADSTVEETLHIHLAAGGINLWPGLDRGRQDGSGGRSGDVGELHEPGPESGASAKAADEALPRAVYREPAGGVRIGSRRARRRPVWETGRRRVRSLSGQAAPDHRPPSRPPCTLGSG